MADRLGRAGPGYDKWKHSESKWPNSKPWLNADPQSLQIPPLKMEDICGSSNEVDEFNASNPTYADWGRPILEKICGPPSPRRRRTSDKRTSSSSQDDSFNEAQCVENVEACALEEESEEDFQDCEDTAACWGPISELDIKDDVESQGVEKQ